METEKDTNITLRKTVIYGADKHKLNAGGNLRRCRPVVGLEEKEEIVLP